MLRLDNRENARIVEMCYKNHTTLINPIIDWTTAEVWEFLKEYNIPYCCLYDEGFHRLGCIGCPMASKAMREYEFERWPKYKNLYMIAFQKMIENRGGGATLSDNRGGLEMVDATILRSPNNTYDWQTAEDMWDGWMEGNWHQKDSQISLI